jgi:ppGpp synthetase/RelA/SpoT-type nucleotidyltranferase
MSDQNNISTDKEVVLWYRDQIEQYIQVFPRYTLYGKTLQQVLEKATAQLAPLAIVQTRPKAIAGFAEKIIRKRAVGNDPVSEFTDLCGGRVITHLPSEVKAVCEFIEKNFDIDWDNSVDVSQRLRTAEFGYRSIHYIVKFKPDIFPTKDIDVPIPEDVFGLKAEIQVRTLLEHTWADFSHNTSYKGAFNIPEKWEREIARIAATLEELDNAYSRIHEGLQTYAASYGTYMTKAQMKDEIDKLEMVLEYDPDNLKIAHHIGKLAITLGDWQKAIDVLSRHVHSDSQPILKDLGVAICKLHKNNPKSREYLQGQEYLERASTLPDRDADTVASLAGTWKGLNDDKARELYRQAFEIDPTDSYALGNYLEYEFTSRRDISLASLIGPVISRAIQKSQDQADVGMNIPWVFYDIGKFYLFLKRPYESITAYAKAIQLSTDAWMMETSLNSLNKLSVVKETLPGFEWVRRLLITGLAAKFPEETAIQQVKKLASTGYESIQCPCVIVVGGNDDNKQQMQSHRNLILEAFKGFNGTIITTGTARCIGEVQQLYPNSIRTIGYVPKQAFHSSIDKRYSEIRYTEGDGISAQEALQGWIDLIASGIQPQQVKLLGIGGKSIAAAEYRIALGLGARVVVVRNSGIEEAKLLSDDDWNISEMLVQLPVDVMTIRAFIGQGIKKLDPNIRDTIARAIHEAYRDVQINRKASIDPSLANWEDLIADLKESNRQQADHNIQKLLFIDCTIHKANGRDILLMEFTEDEVEFLAEMEHARWNAERLLSGWKLGNEKDVIKKISPYIVSWSELPDEVKEWDREAVRKIPEILAEAGLEVHRNI